MNLRRFSSEVVFYGASNGLDAMTQFLVLPFLGRYLLPAELGIADVIGASASLAILSSSGSTWTRHSSATITKARTKPGTASPARTWAISSPTERYSSSWVERLLITFRADISEPMAWTFALLAVPLKAVSDHLATLLRLQHEPKRHFSLMTTRTLVIAAVTLLLLVWLHAGVTSNLRRQVRGKARGDPGRGGLAVVVVMRAGATGGSSGAVSASRFPQCRPRLPAGR